jgi:hypothetical protein
MRISQADLNRRVLTVEPTLGDYYERIIDPDSTASQPTDNNREDDYDLLHNYRNQQGVKVRADMAIKHNDQDRTILIDFTFTEPTAASNGPYDEVGSAAKKAAKRKLKEYSRWDTVNTADSLNL